MKINWIPKLVKVEIRQVEIPYDPCITCSDKYTWVGEGAYKWLWFSWKWKYNKFSVINKKLVFDKILPEGVFVRVSYNY